MSIQKIGFAAIACLGLAACGGTGPGSATSGGPGQPVSGITSSNGGGQRALGNVPSVSIGNGGSATTSVPNTKGASY